MRPTIHPKVSGGWLSRLVAWSAASIPTARVASAPTTIKTLPIAESSVMSAAAGLRHETKIFDYWGPEIRVPKALPADGTMAARSAQGFRHIPPLGQLTRPYTSICPGESLCPLK